MSGNHVNVTTGLRNGERIPDWSVPYALIVVVLGYRGVLAALLERLRIRRKGGYVGLDAVLFLLLYFTANFEGGFKGLTEEIVPWTKQLGGAADRRRIMTQQSMSRLLSAVEEENVGTEFMQWFLQEASEGKAVMADPSTAMFDSLGEPWHMFDHDGTVMALRKRALPEYVDLPEPRRLFDGSFAAQGYSGRKRADLQMCRETLQHAGSGLWLGVWCGPGDGSKRLAVPEAAEIIGQVMDDVGLPRHQGVFRADGMYGLWWVVGCCEDAGIGHLVRWGHYDLLSTNRIIQEIEGGEWERVEDSRSGPVRYAMDLGFLNSPDGNNRTRLVCSRYQDKTGRGVGVSINGWRYELFATSLPAESWAAAQVVSTYYGRVGQENRFAQEDNELNLDYMFSQELHGQALATIVGLYVWNLQTHCGLVLFGDEIPTFPEQPKREIVLQVDAAEFAPPNPLVELLERSVDWQEALPEGFRWEPGYGLECPAGYQFLLKRTRDGSMIFRAPRNVCSGCTHRSQCTSSTQPRYRRELQIKVAADIAAEVSKLKEVRMKISRPRPSRKNEGADTTDRWTPPTGVEAGPLEVVGPYLVPSELRRHFRRAIRGLEVLIRADSSPRPHQTSFVAFTRARRQQRRLTWEARNAWNALPDDATVDVVFAGWRQSHVNRMLLSFDVVVGAASSEKAA